MIGSGLGVRNQPPVMNKSMGPDMRDRDVGSGGYSSLDCLDLGDLKDHNTD